MLLHFWRRTHMRGYTPATRGKLGNLHPKFSKIHLVVSRAGLSKCEARLEALLRGPTFEPF